MAARGINKVILIGFLGADPETRFMANGAAVTNVRLATSDSWKDKNTGQLQERTEWHRVVFFNRLAEVAGEYTKKGSRIFVEGKLVTRKWQDKEGKDQYTTEIHAGELQLLDSRSSGSGQGQGADGGYESYAASYDDYAPASPAPAAAPQRAPARSAPQPAPAAAKVDDFDDDIPF